MASKTKAELIEEATAKGLTLTGDETVADLKKLLNEADDDGDPTPVDEPREPEPVIEPDDPAKHIFLDYGASGQYVREVMQPDEYRERRISRIIQVQGMHDLVPRNVRINLEHVDDSPSGCWCYRHM